MTTVVLGWDGLDYERAQAWSLASAFGQHNRDLAVYDNPALGKPHTYELWPTMITGVGRDAHGIDASEYGAGGGWSNPLVNVAERASRPIPDRLRKPVGRWLRSLGASFAFEGPAYYRERELTTIFDDYDALPIAVPNYRSAADRELDIEHDRGAALAEYLAFETTADGATQHRPAVPLPRLEQRLAREARGKLGIVEQALAQDYDLVWVWLGYLDTLGHLEPVVDEPAWLRSHYERAAAWTGQVRDAMGDDETLVCVSDHGLRDGEHTHAAYLGSDASRVVRGAEAAADVRASVAHVTSADGAATAHSTDSAAADDTRDRLEQLGYL